MNKKLISMIAVLSLCVSVSGCSNKNEIVSSGGSSTSTTNAILTKSDKKAETIGDIRTYINLADNSTSVNGEGVKVDGNTITISTAGTYSISGTLSDGQIVVDTTQDEKTYILLDGVDITCSSSAPINIISSKKVVFALADNSENKISDSTSCTDTEIDAALYSKEDVTFIGNGSLLVNGNYDKGIVSKDDIMIEGGNITVNAINDGIKGKDSVVIRGGEVTVEAGGDGIQAYNADEEGKGYVSLEDGTIKIIAEQDGVQAQTNLLIAGGNIDITSGGGSVNSSTNDSWGQWGGPMQPNNSNPSTSSTEETTSAKAVKATSVIQIDGGTINIDSSDDSIHSNDTLVINDGTISISSGDDGLHSDSTLEINNGTIDISKSYEAIESTEITINNGDIHVVASDDGLNAAGGADSSSTNGRPGQNGMESTTSGTATINGGYLVIDADGDGLDANGNLAMTGGTVIVNGPTNGGNGALDYDGTFDITGGTLIAAGSLGMVQTPSDSSSQNTINISLTSQEANTLVRIESSSGDDVITFAPSKTYSSVVVCTPNINSNEKYNVYVGGSSDGEEKDGLYTEGSYIKGTEVGSCTTSQVVSSVSQSGASSSSGMHGGGGGRGGMSSPQAPQAPQSNGQNNQENQMTRPSTNESTTNDNTQSL